MPRRTRVLLIAELANPDWVSVPLVGWRLFDSLSRIADVHLVTHARNAENIGRTGLPPSRFTTLDSSSVERPLMATANLLRGTRDRGGVGQTLVTAFASLAYYRFEQLLWRALGERIRAREFDIVHRCTPLSPTIPSTIARRCAMAGVPFVLGPINGGLPWPAEFTKERHREREWLSYVRAAHTLMPGYTSTRRHSAAIIAGSRATLEQVPAEFREKCVYVPENGVEPAWFETRSTGPVSLPLRVAFVGRLVPYKQPGLLLEAALPLLKQGRVQLEYMGDGPELPRLKEMAAAEGVDSAVSFPGWIPQGELVKRLARAHVFGFPSVREFGGAVVLQAMALGLVPIVVDYGGPGEQVSARTGFAIPIGPPAQVALGVRAALEQLLREPESIRPRGARARARVKRSLTWEAKAGQVNEIYRWVLGQRDKPDFGIPLTDQ
jgi:starch synthase